MWKRLNDIVSCILQYLNHLCGWGPTILETKIYSGRVYFTVWLQFFQQTW